MTLKRAVARNHKCPGQADPAIPQQAQATENTLLPITVGEYKTRQGHRAFVERTEAALRYAYGFSELERKGKIYRTNRTWGMDSGEALFSRGSGQAFDLVARILKKE
jgi:hypothetical protein